MNQIYLKIAASELPDGSNEGKSLVTALTYVEVNEKNGFVGGRTTIWKPETEIGYESFRRSAISPVDVGLEPDINGRLIERKVFKKGIPEADEIIARVKGIVSNGGYVIAHNADYVREVLKRSGLDLPEEVFIDTVTIARNHYEIERASLDMLALKMGLYAAKPGAEEYARKFLGKDDSAVFVNEFVHTVYLKRFVDVVMNDFGYDFDDLKKESGKILFVPYGIHKGKAVSKLDEDEACAVYFDAFAKADGALMDVIDSLASEKGYVLLPVIKSGRHAGKKINDPEIPDSTIYFLAKKDAPLKDFYEGEAVKRKILEYLRSKGKIDGNTAARLAKETTGPEELKKRLGLDDAKFDKLVVYARKTLFSDGVRTP